jgi:hypothetical protein
MKDKASQVKYGLGSWLPLMLVFAILGYFTYGGINGALAIIAVYFLVSFAAVLSIIPYAGIFVQNYVTTEYVFPYLFSITGIYPTVLTDAIYVFFLVIGIFLWIVITAVASVILYGIFKK